MITFSYKTSQEKRFSTLSLEEAIQNPHLSNSRINEIHGMQALKGMLQNEFPNLNVEVQCDMKLKISSVKIDKSKLKDHDILLKIASLQVSYSSLANAVLLAKKLVSIWDDKKGFLLKFPAGDASKGMSSKFKSLCEEYVIDRYDGFDKSIATGCNHACISCGYAFGAINMPKPDQPYQCPKCKHSMLSERVNYNYRSDNTGKHWGTMDSTELLKSIDVRSIRFCLLSKAQQDKALELQGLDRSILPQHLKSADNDVLNVEVEDKTSVYDDMPYRDICKLVKERKIKREIKDNKFKLISKLIKYDQENSNNE